jgi:radical SAM protein with 4Fe4S-binding SPASM domain
MERILSEAEQRSIPVKVTFELTNRCNERCEMCYVDLDDLEDELTTHEVYRILGELKKAGTLILTLSGGEIFTRKDALDIIRRTRELGMAPRVFTNGTLLREKHADALADIQVFVVEITVFSLDPEVHDKVTRIPGSLERTLRAIRWLRDRDVPVLIKAPLLAGLGDKARAVRDFAAEVGAQCRFDPTVVARYDLDTSPLGLRVGESELVEFCVDPGFDAPVDPEGLREPDPDGPMCATGRRTALISSKGLVYPCSQRYPAAGSLREQSFQEIWETSPLLMKLRNITAQDLDTCSGCSSFGTCGRCALNSLGEEGSFFGPNRWAGRIAEARQQAFLQESGQGETSAPQSPCTAKVDARLPSAAPR